MKSFVDFLTEGKKPDPNPTSSPTGGGSGGGKPPKNPPLSSAEIEKIKRQAQSEMGDSSFDWWDETDDNIKKNRNRNTDDLTKGGDVKTNKPQQKPLKKLIQRASKDQKARGLKVGDLDPKFSAELEAKRKARIDPKTGKATQQGVRNFAQNIGGYRRRNIPKDKLSRIFKYADNVARDPSSKEYKRIEAEINKSDYAGKRAKVSSIKQLEKIKSDIKTSKTIDTKVDTGRGSKAPTNIKTKTTKTPLNTSTRKGKIKYLWKKIKPTSKSSSTPNLNPDQVLSRNTGASGMDSNVPGSQSITKSKPTSTPTSASGKNLYKPHQTPGGTNITTNTSIGMDSNVSGSKITSKTTTKPVIKNTKVDGKTFKSFSKKGNVSKLKISSLASPLIKKGLVGWSAYDNYKSAKGSPLRKAVKSAVTTAAYYKGFGAGATLGTGFGAVTGPGAVVTGTAGGIMGGDLAQKTAGSLFNKVWKPPTKTKTKTSSTTNNKGVGGNGKKDMKWTPIKSGVRLGSGPD